LGRYEPEKAKHVRSYSGQAPVQPGFIALIDAGLGEGETHSLGWKKLAATVRVDGLA
jgi:hypothetical protein